MPPLDPRRTPARRARGRGIGAATLTLGLLLAGAGPLGAQQPEDLAGSTRTDAATPDRDTSAASDATTMDAAARARTAAAAAKLPGVGREWAPLHMADGVELDAAQVAALADRFDVVVAVPSVVSDHADALRAARPGLRVLAYANASFVPGPRQDEFDPALLARDLRGEIITSTGFGNVLMNIEAPDWQAEAPIRCRAAAQRADADGCLADMLTLGIFSTGYLSALPVRPGTDRLWTQREYQRHLVALAEAMTTATDDLVLVGNVVSNGYRYQRNPVSSAPIADVLPAVQMEDFLRGARDPLYAFKGARGWLDDIDVVREQEAAGRPALVTTKLWVDAPVQAQARWHRYTIASFLMAAEGTSLLAFTTSRDEVGASGENHVHEMPNRLGAPLGPLYRDDGGAYRRDFVGGVSLVNPTDAERTVTLDVPHRGLDGTLATEVTLLPHHGDVFVRDDAPVPPGRPERAFDDQPAPPPAAPATPAPVADLATSAATAPRGRPIGRLVAAVQRVVRAVAD